MFRRLSRNGLLCLIEIELMLYRVIDLFFSQTLFQSRVVDLRELPHDFVSHGSSTGRKGRVGSQD